MQYLQTIYGTEYIIQTFLIKTKESLINGVLI